MQDVYRLYIQGYRAILSINSQKRLNENFDVLINTEDLRWGVTEGESKQHKALSVCMDEFQDFHQYYRAAPFSGSGFLVIADILWQ